MDRVAGISLGEPDKSGRHERSAASARRLGRTSAIACVLLIVAYAITLTAGIWTLPSPEVPIGDPYFSMLEILIIVLMLPMVTLMSAVHESSPANAKAHTRVALVFMGLLAGVTGCVHFAILTVGYAATMSGDPTMAFLFSFVWPSVAYALDVFAWDVLFALSVLFAAAAFPGGGLIRWIRVLLIVSGTMALAGLAAVVVSDMRWRFIGIAGYVLVFPAAVACIGVLFHRTLHHRDAVTHGTPVA